MLENFAGMPFRVDITWWRSRRFAVLAFAKRLPFDPAKHCLTPRQTCRCLLSFITIALTFVSMLSLFAVPRAKGLDYWIFTRFPWFKSPAIILEAGN